MYWLGDPAGNAAVVRNSGWDSTLHNHPIYDGDEVSPSEAGLTAVERDELQSVQDFAASMVSYFT